MGKFDIDSEYFVGDRAEIRALFMEFCQDLYKDTDIPDAAKTPIFQKLIDQWPQRAESKLRPKGSAISMAIEAARSIASETLEKHRGVDPGRVQAGEVRRYTDLTRERISRAVLSHLPDHPVIANKITVDELDRCEAGILAMFDPVETEQPNSARAEPPRPRKARYGDISPAKRPDCEEFLSEVYALEIEAGTLTRNMIRRFDGPLFTALYEKYKHNPEKMDQVLPRQYARRKNVSS